jgi:hypothetical protein
LGTGGRQRFEYELCADCRLLAKAAIPPDQRSRAAYALNGGGWEFVFRRKRDRRSSFWKWKR